MARDLIDTSDIRKELEALKADLSKVRKDVSDVVGAVLDTGKRQGSGVSEQLRSEFGRRLNGMNDRYNRAREKGMSTMRQARRQASGHPVVTLFGAVVLASVVAAAAEWWRLRRR